MSSFSAKDFDVTAYAPASIGNLTTGYDLLGMALENPGDEVSVRFNETGKIQLLGIAGDGGKLPLSPLENTATVAIQTILNQVDEKRGIDVFVRKQMPLGSGMGSSAASAVAGAVAVNALLGNPLTKHALIPAILAGEAVASGEAHGDNAIPSLLGGIVLILNYHPLEIIELPVPQQLHYSLVHPELKIFTKEARKVVPKSFPIQTVIRQMGLLSGLVAGLYSSDYELISRNLKDHLAEPYRQNLIAGFEEVKAAALKAGALNCGISGSGPSIYALSTSKETAQKAAFAMKKAFEANKIAADAFFDKVNLAGASIL